jgi:phosphoglycolate phosphatase
MAAFDLVMFDLDGTLVETAPEIMDAVNDTLELFDLPLVSQQQVNDWIGHGTLSLLIQAVAFATGSTPEAVRASASLPEMVAHYNRHYNARCGTNSRLYPGVQTALDGLRAQGMKLAVVTNKESRYTEVVMQAHGLHACVDKVICGDTLPTKKPDPAGVQACLQAFAVAPERALFVGDSSIDVATARRAGVPVWVLPYGYNMGQPIASCAADRIIQSCAELLQV